MKLNAEFIPLPYRFDAVRMATEIAQFDGLPWMDHPDNTEGNSALALISCGGGDNNGFRGEMKPTPHLARCPYLQQVIASFGEVTMLSATSIVARRVSAVVTDSHPVQARARRTTRRARTS